MRVRVSFSAVMALRKGRLAPRDMLGWGPLKRSTDGSSARCRQCERRSSLLRAMGAVQANGYRTKRKTERSRRQQGVQGGRQ